MSAKRINTITRGWLIFCLAALIGALGCSSKADDRSDLLVFAATSLTDVLAEIGSAFDAHSGTGVNFSFGGSQMLAQQIVKGAPADVFISAGRAQVELLRRKGLTEPQTTDLLSNKLVVVTRSDGPRLQSIEQLNTALVERMAVAAPDLAPAGWYARDSLSRLGLWDDLQPKLVLGQDVRATLAYVESGNVDAALVYATDAMVAGDVRVVDIVPPESYAPIVYPAVVLRRSAKRSQSARFLEFVRGDTATAIFEKHGFEPLRP